MNLASAAEGTNLDADDGPNNIIVRRYTEIGIVKGYGKITVEAREGVILDARHIS